MEKSIQRKNMIKLLEAMDPAVHQLKSDAIRKYVLADKEFQEANVIGVTISAFPEVDTIRLIEECWKYGKKVAVPKCNPIKRTMTFRLLENFNQLETVYMKLKEPVLAKTDEVYPQQIDLLIVPGVVFSPDGFRIGFGGGYYDRFLTQYTSSTISLAFESQVTESLTVEAHDLPVQRIFTERGVLDKGRGIQ